MVVGLLLFTLLARCSGPPDATPQLDAAVPDAGGPDAAIDAEDADAGEWIRFTLHGDQIPTTVYIPLEDGGFERERIDGGVHEYRASQTFRSAFVHNSTFDQFSVGGLGPLSLTVEVQDGGARACDQFAYPSSVRLGNFDVVSRNASCTIALDRVPRCPGDRISGTFSALLVDRTSGASLPVTDGAFSVRLSFVSHGEPNPQGCPCIPGSSTTNPQCM
ncbi:MAG: hypothetical protein Q8N23_19230 [Archangium sp.]|nr:hypothetical protein [Archangium sp.]MDP3154820.1 hypothetical protein [Archangium sp.]MDP3575044.1 hypothetical protein [Archangium sp.]